jgi:hypothetical protein
MQRLWAGTIPWLRLEPGQMSALAQHARPNHV